MVLWWGTYSYFNNELIQFGDIEVVTSANGSSRSFVSRSGSKCIGNNTYKVKRINLCSKPKPIHVLVNKYELYFSYSRSHVSWLPQAVSKGIMNSLYRKLAMLLW